MLKVEVRQPKMGTPAYRYFRETDELPEYGELGDDPVCKVKLFLVGSRYEFHAAALTDYDGELVVTGYVFSPLGPDCDEFGDEAVSRLLSLRSPVLGALPLERDLHYTPTRVSELQARTAKELAVPAPEPDPDPEPAPVGSGIVLDPDRYDLSTRVRRDEKTRRVVFGWVIGTIPADDYYEHGRSVVAELTISHHKGGSNVWTGEVTTEDYFSVSIANVQEYETPGGARMTRYTLFSGLEITRIPAGNRYSAKKLEQAEREGYEEFRRHFDAGHPQVLAFFDGSKVGP